MPIAPSTVPEPQLANSPRLDHLIRDGKLYISLQDAIALALENNLDLAIARYNLPIADTDILRTKAGGSFRGVNTGVVQGTPGGGVGGFGTGAPGAGAGGTTGGAGGAGAGAAGLVQSTLGIGTPVQSYDPIITGNMGIEHLTQPLGQPADLRCAVAAAEHWRSQPQLPAGVSHRNQLHLRSGQQPANHEQYFQQPQSAAGVILPRHRAAATAGGIRTRPQSALPAHRQEQQEDLRHRLQEPGGRDRHADRQHLLGPGERLRGRAGQRAVVSRSRSRVWRTRKSSCSWRPFRRWT